MSVTLEQLTAYLDNKDLKYKYEEDKERIVLISGDEDITNAHFIRVREDGDIFEWQMQILDSKRDIVTIKEHKYAAKVLSHLLYLNYKTKFGTWEFDPSDGDIRLAVEIPLEDAIMTEKQFNRVAGFMLGDASEHTKGILSILETGETPVDDSESSMIAALEAMLSQLKGESSTDTTDGI